MGAAPEVGSTRRRALPPGFSFGVASAGFQIEGGYNGPGEPRNNWYAWESSGRVEPSGTALGFWDRYEEYLDLVADLGCDSFRLSIEWARVVPGDGHVDEAAIGRYRDMLAACARRSLTPLVTLHHFTHPEWLGEDFWLREDAPQHFDDWVALAIERFGDLCRHWVTVNEANVLAAQTYLFGDFPPGRVGALGDFVRALDHLVAGHVLAYGTIKDRQPEASVSTNNYSLSIYELDRLMIDLLCWRSHGIETPELDDWLREQRASHYAALGVGPRPGVALERALRALAARALPLRSAFARTRAAVTTSEHHRPLDVAQLDFYLPRAADQFQWPGHRTSGDPHRVWWPARALWDNHPDPAALRRAIEGAQDRGLEIWVVENGMCNRVRRGRSYTRLDGWTRDRYLRQNVGAVVDAIDAGAPVTGYWHWTLADNYEWGTYEPRFGLYGVDRERGVVLQETDAMGVDAAGTYRRLISGLRAGDRSVLDP